VGRCHLAGRKIVSFYSRKSAPGHSQASRYGRKPIQSLRQRSDEESEHQDASLRALYQTERSETGQFVRSGSGPAPGPLLGSHGERSRPQSRIRIPPDLQRIPATLQDDVGPDVARLVGHFHRRRGTTFARSAHLGHRVRLWQDENFHQEPAHGKVAAPMRHLLSVLFGRKNGVICLHRSTFDNFKLFGCQRRNFRAFVATLNITICVKYV
jgi:hypothetical protein